MSLLGIASGALNKAAELRTSKSGKPFAVFTLRETVNGATRWLQCIAFSESAIADLKEMEAGEPIAVAGEITAEIYAPAGADSRINWRVRVDGVLTARRKPKSAPEGASRKPQAPKGRDRDKSSSTGGRALASKSWASPATAEVETPLGEKEGAFDDEIPF
jgi:hypothetical protein